MANKMKRVFYNLVYSPDDGGWYAEVFDEDCNDLYETPVCNDRESRIRLVKSKYPNAELL